MSATNFTLDVSGFLRNLRSLRYREVTMTLATLAVFAGAVALFPGASNVTRGIDGEVSAGLIATVVVVAVVAGAVKGMLGFGYALVATPVLASVVDPTLAVVVLAVPPWMINAFQIGETDTGLAFVREEWTLLLLAVVGSVVGVFFLASYEEGPLVPFLIGLVLAGYVVFQVVQGFVTVEGAHHPVALAVAGGLEGFLLAASNLGPLLPAYFHTFERDADRYIGGLSMVLGTIFTVRILQMGLLTLYDGRLVVAGVDLLGGAALLTPYRLWLGCVVSIVTLVGLLAGTYLRRLEVDRAKFDRFVVGLLALIALNIFRKTVPALFL